MNKEMNKEIKKLRDKRILLTKTYSFDEVREIVETIDKETKKEILEIINHERDNGNIEGEKGFSPALCLSKIIKYCEGEVNSPLKKDNSDSPNENYLETPNITGEGVESGRMPVDVDNQVDINSKD